MSKKSLKSLEGTSVGCMSAWGVEKLAMLKRTLRNSAKITLSIASSSLMLHQFLGRVIWTEDLMAAHVSWMVWDLPGQEVSKVAHKLYQEMCKLVIKVSRLIELFMVISRVGLKD